MSRWRNGKIGYEDDAVEGRERECRWKGKVRGVVPMGRGVGLPCLKLCGFLEAVLIVRWPPGKAGKVTEETLVGRECWLSGSGSGSCLAVDQTEAVLVPCRRDEATGFETGVEDCTPDRDIRSSDASNASAECTPVSDVILTGNSCGVDVENSREVLRSNSKRKSSSKGKGSIVKKAKIGGSYPRHARCCSILHQLQSLTQKNNSSVVGRVLRLMDDGICLRAVVLIDVHLSASLWTGHSFWKGGSMVAAALSHFRCDWKERTRRLEAVGVHNYIASSEEPSFWDVGDCSVLGCKHHFQLSDKERRERFDLHSIFSSLPTYNDEKKTVGTPIQAEVSLSESSSGMWSMPDEILTSILNGLMPKDLHSAAGVCRHLRNLARWVMPCLNLNLYPHQQAAVRWMLQREENSQPVPHPFVSEFHTEDGFIFYLDCVSGELSSEMPPTLTDFRGGLFCDEPGLGKTVTALSLILKTQGTLSEPPEGVVVRWCEHNSDQKYGYYEISNSAFPLGGMSALKRCTALKARRYNFDSTDVPIAQMLPAAKRARLLHRADNATRASSSTRSVTLVSQNNSRAVRVPFVACSDAGISRTSAVLASSSYPRSNRVSLVTPTDNGARASFRRSSSTSASPSNKSSSTASPVSASERVGGLVSEPNRLSLRVKRKLWDAVGNNFVDDIRETRAATRAVEEYRRMTNPSIRSTNTESSLSFKHSIISEAKHVRKKTVKSLQSTVYEGDENWVQCDACGKWRKLPVQAESPKEGLAWFCSMNKDVLRQDCVVPEEVFDTDELIKSMPGFIQNEADAGLDLNVSFFRNVLKEHSHLLDTETKGAVSWVASLSYEKLMKAAANGLQLPPGLRLVSVSGDDRHQYDKLFIGFGFVKHKEKKKGIRWAYPKGLNNLVFDSSALKIALSDPVDDVTRFYLSKATLVVVPQNLIEHWRTQIKKHTTTGHLRVYVWNEQKDSPRAHSLAWNYDIVITTFNRLSMEWSSRETSILVRIHWLRLILDEGHTLGASLSLTNKLQMAISMRASRRWLLTGTPTPNTPSSQVAHLQPMLKFLHEEAYGKHQKSWEGAILKPFESGSEEGRERLLGLLRRCMISARKADLRSIPPCIRKVKLLDFTQQHGASYNELVLTVKRNILMADWNDPSHVESLLNPKQWKFRSSTIKNVRLSCCVAGHIKFRNAGEDIKETMDLFVEQGMDPLSEEFKTIKSSLTLGGNCQRCNEWCRLPIITPCRHLLCLTCVALDCEKCSLLGCGNPYKMQSPVDNARPENPNPKWPVPQDLIELQPSYVQHNWNPDWQSTSSSKVAYLVEQLKILQVSNRKLLTAGIHDEHDQDAQDMSAYFFNEGNVSHVDNNCLPEKVIVFSQFLEHIHVVEEQFTAVNIQFARMYSPMPLQNKMKSLMTFQDDPQCMVLVMDGSAALGLDLSFVSHVYLMEPIWDRSMEEQVVSRAHRMGASRPILVQTLAMRGTIEEQMLEFLKAPEECTRESEGEYQEISEQNKPFQRIIHVPAESSYLAHLEFIQTKANGRN